MFKYNKFWHFWHTLNNRAYFNATAIAILATVIISTVFFPVLWATYAGIAMMAFVPALTVLVTVQLFTRLSNVFYDWQNQTLRRLKSPNNLLLNEELDLYIDRRVVCPESLLAGTISHSPNISHIRKPTVVQPPIMLTNDVQLQVTPTQGQLNRNPSFIARSNSSPLLFIKRAAPMDSLSEVAAREMADLMGFSGLIPNNTVSRNQELPQVRLQNTLSLQPTNSISSAHILRSEATIRNLKANLTPGAQKHVAKFLSHMQSTHYKLKARQEGSPKLLCIQKVMENAIDGSHLITLLYNLPNRGASSAFLTAIDQSSFEDNFLLQIILGVQDGNPGNTLFVNTPNAEGRLVKKMYSIDNERIMPENNYNMSKKIPVANGSDLSTMTERSIDNVFPLRLWLAGLPQADVPFSRHTIMKTLKSLDCNRLLAYHRYKKLFSPAAVGAQLDRVRLIRDLFESELNNNEIQLTPKQLFLKLVNNHPSYMYLKHNLKLSDFMTFALLGQIPEDAEMSLFLHPLQYFPMFNKIVETVTRQMHGEARLFTDESFESVYAPRTILMILASNHKQADSLNQASADLLQETSESLRRAHAMTI